jgi:hypothetical protein
MPADLSVWTLCRVVAFTYGMFVLHDLVFLVVVGADLFGRFAVATLIVRARAIGPAPRRSAAARHSPACEPSRVAPAA